MDKYANIINEDNESECILKDDDDDDLMVTDVKC